jgi:hypothetical protein
MLPMVGKVIPPEYILKALKYSPLPSSVVAELEEMAKAPNPQAQQDAAMRAKAAAAQIDETLSKAELNRSKAQAEGMPQQGADPMAAAQMEWKKALLDSLTKMEVAKINAGTDMDSAALDAQIEAFLGLTGLASDHVKQMRDHAHQKALAEFNAAHQPERAAA